MIDHYISRVPTSVWRAGQPDDTSAWETAFNLMACIQVDGSKGRLELVVEHTDSTGNHCCCVDICDVRGAQTTLLASQVRLRFCGEVSSMRIMLRLTNRHIHYHLKELWIQGTNSARLKLIEPGHLAA